jgi:hypothetical protein
MLNRAILIAFVLLTKASMLLASAPDSLPVLQYADRVYVPNIKTVRLYPEGLELYPPIITLTGGEKLLLSFDDLGEEIQSYNYTFQLCNADWTPNDMSQYDYLTGFIEGSLYDYSLSRATRIPYAHHTLAFPNADLQFTKSGNYLLKVYRENDPEQLAITRRFYVLDTKLNVDGTLKNPGASQYFLTHQEVQFDLNIKDITVTNPFDEISVTVMQNFRTDNAYTGLKPQFVKQEQLIYRNDSKIVFPGLKEFRYFDSRNLMYLGQHVKEYDRTKNLLYLYPDEVRSFKSYEFVKDANGQYIIEKSDARTNELEADYVDVRFRLATNNIFPGSSVYVMGAFTNWQLTEDYKMEYNFTTKSYEKDILLKQGFYNYLYTYIREGETVPDADTFEGSSYETENSYQILVYYHPSGTRYDQLIGFKEMNTLKQ